MVAPQFHRWPLPQHVLGLLAACVVFSAPGCTNLVPGPEAFAPADGAGTDGDTGAGSDAAVTGDGGPDSLVPPDGTEDGDVGAQTDAVQTDAVQTDVAETDAVEPDAGASDVADVEADASDVAETDAQASDVGPDIKPGDCQVTADCAAKEDGNLCNGTLVCDTSGANNKCVLDAATVKNCDDSNPCTNDTCTSGTGECQHANVAANTTCDDGDPCTTTLCDSGQCKETEFTCECKTSADCAQKEANDGDLCNGVFYCEPVSKSCQIKPGSVVTCGTGSDTPCKQNLCNKQTGKCEMTVKAGFLIKCDDDNPCTTGDTCEEGTCVSGTNTCTCLKDADCASEEDGKLCNGTLFCDKSELPPVCRVNPKTVISCPTASDTDCAKNVCNDTSGACEVKFTTDNQPCNDDDPCTSAGSCKSGSCNISNSSQCGCTSDDDCADDGNLCDGQRFCNKSTKKCEVNPFTVVTCPTGDDTACQQNTCDKATGKCALKAVNEGKLCDGDGTACTQDSCVQGECLVGANLCGCNNDAECAGKDDGDLCNGTLFCDKSVEPATCKVNPATVKTCPTVDNTACFSQVCNTKTGACEGVNKANNTPCDDGVACTPGDTCLNGVCKAGADLCFCAADSDCLDDGDKCNGVPYCDKTGTPFSCKVNPATVVTCQGGGLECLQNTCNSHTGQCQQAPSDSKCDDSNPCTVDACNSGTGSCSHVAVVEATPCAGGVCVAGACEALGSDELAIPAGNAQMGCNLSSGCPADELPQHTVTLPTFAIDRFEVTVQQFEACVQSGNCTASAASGSDLQLGQIHQVEPPDDVCDLGGGCGLLPVRQPSPADRSRVGSRRTRQLLAVWQLQGRYTAIPVGGCHAHLFVGSHVRRPERRL